MFETLSFEIYDIVITVILVRGETDIGFFYKLKFENIILDNTETDVPINRGKYIEIKRIF